MRATLKNVEEISRLYLSLKYHLVGVKLIRESIATKGYPRPYTPIAFCQMVRKAFTNGDSFLYGLDYEKCTTAQVVLGFRDLKYVQIDCRVMPPETRKVLISPLNEINDGPEVVLAILTPKQMMDLTVILQAGKNAPLSAEFMGEHACAEFFAKPYMEGKPNISLLCNGVREKYSDFRDDEIIFGVPLKVYTQAAETIERINKIGGTLCGCRTSDIPPEITNEFGKVGFSKGTDYFFGKVSGHNVRVYLNKGLNGRLKFITIHLPMKMQSGEMAEKLTEKLMPLSPRPYFVSKRGYWLDLTVRTSEDALGIDLFDGLSVRAAIEEFAEKITECLSKVERINLYDKN